MVVFQHVSILVLLDVALKGCADRDPGSTEVWVSILVLLDVALKAVSFTQQVEKGNSFNPCSLGCCSERRSSYRGTPRDALVSILVLLDVALKGRVFLQIFLRIQRKKPLLYTSCA